MANEDRVELEPVNLSDLSFDDTDEFPEGFDPSEDAFEQAPPIPDGLYKFKLALNEETPYEAWKNKQDKQEVKASFSCEVVKAVKVPQTYAQDALEGAKVFDSASTQIPRGKSTCTMAGLLREILQDGKYKKFGPIPKKKSDLVALFDKLMRMEPVLEATTYWQAWEQAADGESGFGKALKKGMENFPKGKDGRYIHILMSKKTGEITAKAKIKRWIGVDTAKMLAEKPKAGTVSGVRSVVPKATTVQDEEIPDDNLPIEEEGAE